VEDPPGEAEQVSPETQSFFTGVMAGMLIMLFGLIIVSVLLKRSKK
jgi:hypothetical protein